MCCEYNTYFRSVRYQLIHAMIRFLRKLYIVYPLLVVSLFIVLLRR